jgi:hypothetical protein
VRTRIYLRALFGMKPWVVFGLADLVLGSALVAVGVHGAAPWAAAIGGLFIGRSLATWAGEGPS